MGRPPTCYDLFMFTHTKDHDGKTLDERAKQVQVSKFPSYLRPFINYILM